MPFKRSINPRSSIRAKVYNLFCSVSSGNIANVYDFILKKPVTFSKASGNSNLVVDSSGNISSSGSITPGELQTIVVTATGSDGSTRPHTFNFTGLYSISNITINVDNSVSSGTIVSNITGVPLGQTPTLVPNDGKFIIGGDETGGWKLVKGLVASSGTVNYNITAIGANSGAVAITITTVVNVTPPSISLNQSNSTYTLTPGTWTGSSSTKTYQWYRDGSPISGETSTTYVHTSIDNNTDINVIETLDSFSVSSNTINWNGNTYDYLISTNADWTTIPSTLKTNGGIIGVAPGNYNDIEFTAQANSLLTVTGTDPNNLPVINRLKLGNLKNVKLTKLKIVTDQWGSPNYFALQFGTPTNNICTCDGVVDLDGLVLRANYRGDINSYDTFDFSSDNYPEYANIHGPITGGSFAVGELYVPPNNKYVGNTVPDGTTALVPGPQAGSGTGFQGFMTVVNGEITYAECTAGGTGYSNATNASKGYGTVSWPGKTEMAVMMAACADSPNGYGLTVLPTCTFYFRNSHFGMANFGFRPSNATILGTLNHWNNTYDGIYTDFFACALTGSTAPVKISHRWNKMGRQFCRVGDPLDPHGDGIQHWLDNGVNTWIPRIELIGNRALNATGTCRALEGQFIFMADPGTVPSGPQAYELHAVGNVGMLGAPNGMIAEIGSNCFIYGNTVVPGKPAEHTGPMNIYVSNGATSKAYGQSYIANNIAERCFVGAAASAFVTLENNTNMGSITDPSFYAQYFGVTTNPSTIAETETMRKGVGIHADRGAYRNSAWIDHNAMTYDPTLEPSFIRFPTIINQNPNTSVVSAWAKLIGGPDTQSVSASNGTFETATFVDTFGNATGVVAGQTSGNLARGTWIRMRQTTASTGSTFSTATLTVRGTYNFTFNAVTSTAASFTIADNQNAAYSRIANANLPTFTGGKGLILAVRIRTDTYTNNDVITACGSTFGLIYSGNQWRLTLISSSQVAGRFVMSQASGQMQTLIFAIDLTQTDMTLGMKCMSNGNQLSLASSNNAFPSAGTTTISNTNLWPSQNLGVMANNTGGAIYDGAIEWLWLDYYTNISNMPNITDPFIFSEFSADKFNSNGSTTILSQPALFYGGLNKLTEWNGTFPNGGRTQPADLVRIAGTYV